MDRLQNTCWLLLLILVVLGSFYGMNANTLLTLPTDNFTYSYELSYGPMLSFLGIAILLYLKVLWKVIYL